MLRKSHIRHPLAAALVILGGVLIFFAPETWAGIVLLALGVSVELLGIALKRGDEQ